MKNMKVTIIVPVYNVEQYAADCLQSIVRQDYPGPIECILVNDASTDHSESVVDKFLQEYKGLITFKKINHSHNQGLSAARNTGLSEANGDYIYFLDSDDELLDDSISKMVRVAEKYKFPDMVLGSTRTIGGEMKCLILDANKLPDYSNDRIWIKKSMLSNTTLPMNACNKLIRRDFVLKNNLFFKEGIIHEDDYWNFFCCKVIHTIAFCFHSTYVYKIRANSITQKKDNTKHVVSLYVIIKICLKNIDEICKVEQVNNIKSLYGALYASNYIRYKDIEHSIFSLLVPRERFLLRLYYLSLPLRYALYHWKTKLFK